MSTALRLRIGLSAGFGVCFVAFVFSLAFLGGIFLAIGLIAIGLAFLDFPLPFVEDLFASEKGSSSLSSISLSSSSSTLEASPSSFESTDSLSLVSYWTRPVGSSSDEEEAVECCSSSSSPSFSSLGGVFDGSFTRGGAEVGIFVLSLVAKTLLGSSLYNARSSASETSSEAFWVSAASFRMSVMIFCCATVKALASSMAFPVCETGIAIFDKRKVSSARSVSFAETCFARRGFDGSTLLLDELDELDELELDDCSLADFLDIRSDVLERP